MLQGIWTVFAAIIVGLLIYRYNRQVIAALRNFDRRNVERIEQEYKDKTDSLAHFRQTASVAEEQVEEIGEMDVIDMRLGTKVKRYVFEGELFETRDAAEAARMRSVVQKARDYYKELPAALAARGKDRLH